MSDENIHLDIEDFETDGLLPSDSAILRLMKLHVRQEEALFRAGDARMAAIEADLRPIRKMYWAVVGSAVVGTLLLATVVFFYKSDREDFRHMQTVLHEQGAAIKVLIASHSNLQRENDREHDRFNSSISRIEERKK